MLAELHLATGRRCSVVVLVELHLATDFTVVLYLPHLNKEIKPFPEEKLFIVDLAFLFNQFDKE